MSRGGEVLGWMVVVCEHACMCMCVLACVCVRACMSDEERQSHFVGNAFMIAQHISPARVCMCPPSDLQEGEMSMASVIKGSGLYRKSYPWLYS